MSTQVYIRNPDLTRGMLVDNFESLKMTPVFNDIGSWTMNIDYRTAQAAEVVSDEGFGIMVIRDDAPLFSGPIKLRHRSWAAGSDSSAEKDMLTLAGPDDNYVLATRLVLPCASLGGTGLIYPTAEYHAEPLDDAETVMRNFVDAHAGSSAATGRSIAGLTFGTNENRGTSVKEQGRFNSLLELLQRTAMEGGGLGFRVAQVGSVLQFQVYEPVDRSGTVIFSKGFGNLVAFEYETKAPTGNFAIIAGGGEGTSRTFAEDGDYTSIAKWGRVETLRDRRDTSDTTELNQTISDEIAKGAERTSLKITPLELQPDPSVDFNPYLLGVHYNVGDQITVRIDDVPITEVVQSAEIMIEGGSFSAKPLVGGPNATDPTVPDYFARQRKVETQVKALETR